jgi:hypothetical protein
MLSARRREIMKRASLIVGSLCMVGLAGCLQNDPGSPDPAKNNFRALVLTARTNPPDDGQQDAVDLRTIDRADSKGEEIIADVAFDFASDGRVMVLSTDSIGNTKENEHFTRLASASGTFSGTTTAPLGGYSPDVQYLETGKLVFVQMFRVGACRDEQFKYSKIGLDSVNLVTRKIFIRVVSNPNCEVYDVSDPPPGPDDEE